MAIRVCVAGPTGWTDRAVTGALLGSSDFQLIGASARRQEGIDIGEALGHGRAHVTIVASLEEAPAVYHAVHAKRCLSCYNQKRRERGFALF